ncbi:MAG: tetratricopeptide repeat protein [bacterium]|nr:tetratricopeptide repeat protein [bacterium]
MSLIRDALKKAQQERDRDQSPDVPGSGENHNPPEPGHAREAAFFTPKRLIVYSLIFLVVVIGLVMVTIVFKPATQSSMKVLRNTGDTGREVPTQQAQTPPTVQEKHVTPAPSQTPPPPQKQPVRRETRTPVTVKRTPVKKFKKTKPARPQIEAKERPAPGKKIPAKVSGCEALIADGDRLVSRRNFVLAVDRYKKALKLEKRVSLYLKLYSAFRALKNKVLAGAYVREGLTHFPDSFSLNKVSAILHIRARAFDKALVNIETALTRNKGDYALLTYKGLCYFHKRDYEQALLSFKESLDLDADAVENYYYIGLIYDNVKDYAKALEFYRVFFKLNPEDRNFKHRNWVISRIRKLEKNI